MVLDQFYRKPDQEIKKMLNEWFFELEYLERLRVLLRVYEKLNVTKIEEQGVSTLWRKISLQRQKGLYQENWQYHM
jgi:hypothetical protein